MNKGESVVFLGTKNGRKMDPNLELSMDKKYTLIEVTCKNSWITINNDTNHKLGLNLDYYHFELLSTIRKQKLKKLEHE